MSNSKSNARTFNEVGMRRALNDAINEYIIGCDGEPTPEDVEFVKALRFYAKGPGASIEQLYAAAGQLGLVTRDQYRAARTAYAERWNMPLDLA